MSYTRRALLDVLLVRPQTSESETEWQYQNNKLRQRQSSCARRASTRNLLSSLQLVYTAPPSLCEWCWKERCSLRRLSNYRRASMGDERLGAPAFILMHDMDIAPDEAVVKFRKIHQLITALVVRSTTEDVRRVIAFISQGYEWGRQATLRHLLNCMKL